MHQRPDLARLAPLVLTLVAVAFYWLATTLSTHWVTRKERKRLAAALGRPVQSDEEESISGWLRVPDADLAATCEETEKDPFKPMSDIAELELRDAARLPPTPPYTDDVLKLDK